MRTKLICVPLTVMAMVVCLWCNPKKPAAPQFGYGPGKGVNLVAFSPDGQTVAAAGFDQPASLTITLWDITTGKERRTLSSTAPTIYEGMAFSPDLRTLATGSSLNTDTDHFTVTLWDVGNGRSLHGMAGHTKEIDDVAFTPDGRTLASGSQDQSIKLWDVATGKLLRAMYDNVGMEGPMAFSPDGHLLASASNNYLPANNNAADEINTIDLWDATSGKAIQTLPRQKVWTSAVAFSPDGRILASADWEYTITLWDVATWQTLRTLAGHTDVISSLTFSPDGRTLASGSNDRTAKLWDVATGQVVHTLSGHTDSISSVAFSPDGRTLASGSQDNTIKLWDVASGKLLSTFGVPNPQDLSTTPPTAR